VSKLNSCLIALLLFCSASSTVASDYAAIVLDADSGRVLHESDSTLRWYPASLTKVMTLYLAFQALESGRLHLDELLIASPHAARQPKSRIGLRSGQSIRAEQAIQAVATRSANDAAVLLAERLGGSESSFAQMMTDQAQRLGMYNSQFRNASGLPDEGQISSARDLALLASTLIHQYPQYYRYFSAQEINYQGRMLPSTNRILKSYPDADGMKTGFTCGSGYNLIASAKRNGHRIIGVLLGGHSSAERFHEMERLLDLGFERSNGGTQGMAIAQLRGNSDSQPPYQLSSNRCAGSEAHMGELPSVGSAPVLAVAAHHDHRHHAQVHGKSASATSAKHAASGKHATAHAAKEQPSASSKSKAVAPKTAAKPLAHDGKTAHKAGDSHKNKH
jgi:D-alanyl-D-alanine carboxypeptidase